MHYQYLELKIDDRSRSEGLKEVLLFLEKEQNVFANMNYLGTKCVQELSVFGTKYAGWPC